MAAPVTADAVAFWAGREADTYNTYWSASAQPHRHSLVNALHMQPPFKSLLEVGCYVGTNLNLIRAAFPWVSLSGTDVNVGAIAYAQDRQPDVAFRCRDLVTEAAAWPNRSVDMIVSCYALAYIGPEHLGQVLTAMCRAARVGLVFVEPAFGPLGLITGIGFPEWRHPYHDVLVDAMQTASRKGTVHRQALTPPVDRCDGLYSVTFKEN